MKDSIKTLFKTLYVDQCKSAKEAAAITGISEKTAGEWVKKYGLKSLRDTKLNSPDQMIINIKSLLSQLAEEQIQLQSDPTKTMDEKIARRAQIADEVSKWNKVLEKADRENKVPLADYLKVMELIFDAMRDQMPKCYRELIDWQEKHILEVAVRYA
jgi:hypothetical protein